MPPLPVTAASRRRPNRRTLLRAALFAAAGLLIGGGASGYRFFVVFDAEDFNPDGSFNGSRIADAEGAVRWSTARWPSGQVLEFVIADSPAWTESWVSPWDEEGETQPPPFEDTRDALPFVREAMAAWSGIPTADIRWRVTGVESVPGFAEDGRNSINIVDEDGFVGRAWVRRPSSFDVPDEILECDIELIPGAAAFMGSDYSTNLTTIIHELGHCLGLAHSATSSHWYGGGYGPEVGIVGQTPQMSYGVDISNALTIDDIVGASLLRPSSGWTRRTGAISGRVTVSGEPARFAAVGSVRLLMAGQTAPGPGVFTDENGAFRLEGLVPGDYLIRAGSMIAGDANPGLFMAGATLAADGVRLSPVAVRAGEETGDISLNLPPDRQSTRVIQ